MIDIKVSSKDMSITVYRNGNEVKSESITVDEYREYMVELSGDEIDVIRKAFKLFKPTEIIFKDVK